MPGKVLAHRLLTRQTRPEAVFCATDLLACGFMDAARLEFGLRVPEQLCIVGFDDIEQASWESYKLTTFAQPLHAIANAAVSWLCDLEEKDDVLHTSRVVLEPELIWRRSVRGG